MGTQTTTNYGWVYPNPFEEDDAWGTILNAAFVDIDADLKVVQTAVEGKQPLDPQLTALAGVTAVSDALPYFTGATTAAVTTLTAAGRALLDDADAAAQRTTLGLGGLATLSAVGASEITDGSVGTAELADGSVATAKVADGAVTTVKLANGSVTTAKIVDANVTTAKIADGAITAAKLAAGAAPAAFPAGTRMLFQQTSAPTGWTKDTTHNDKALRVVNGSVSSGGSLAFSSAFASRSYGGSTSTEATGGTVGDTALTLAQIPAHSHSVGGFTNTTGSSVISFAATSSGSSRSTTTGSEGSGATHTHSFTGSSHAHTYSGAIDITVQYVDLIIAQKD